MRSREGKHFRQRLACAKPQQQEEASDCRQVTRGPPAKFILFLGMRKYFLGAVSSLSGDSSLVRSGSAPAINEQVREVCPKWGIYRVSAMFTRTVLE